MGSQTLALFYRALRVDVRQLPSHIMRLGLIGFVLITLLWAQATAIVMGAPGLTFFMQISYINLGFATLAGPLLFATCITEEKEEQTLGLLRMANVGPLSLLLGKLAPRLASALLILIVQFPFTLLAITLGGVTWTQVIAAFCSLLAHVLLIANVGLFCSVIGRRTSSVVGLCAVLLIAYLIVPWILYSVLSSGPPPPGAATSSSAWVRLVATAQMVGEIISREVFHSTALYQLWVTLTTGFDGGPLNLQVISNLAGGCVLFVLGWAVFDLFNRNVDVASPGAARSLAGLFRRKGRAPVRAWSTAIVGREFRFGVGGYTACIVKLLVYGPMAYLMMALNQWSIFDVNLEELGGILMIGTLFVVLPIEATVLASRLFRAEIKDKTWSTLYMLPRSLMNVAYSKVGGTLLALAPAVFYFFLGTLLYPEGVRDFLNELYQPQAVVAVFLMIAHFVFFLHLVTWFSILTNSWTGVLLALLTWFGGMWAFYFCLMIPMFMGVVTGSMNPENYLLAVNIISAWALIMLAVLIHVQIGQRLRSAAAL